MYLGKIATALLFLSTICLQVSYAEEQAQKTAKPLKELRQVEPASKVPLKLPYVPDPKATSPFDKAKLAVFEEFKRQNPEIEIQQFSGISIQGMSQEAPMMLAIAGGSAADIMAINFRMSETYIGQTFLYPLDEFIKRDVGETKFMDQIPKPLWPVVKRYGPTVGKVPEGEHIWCIPGGGYLVRAMVWRKDMFEEAGLDPNVPPKNWAELLACVQKLSDPAKKRYGISIARGPQASWDFMPYLWSAGANVVEKGPDGQWRACFNTEAGAKALDFYLKLTSEEWTDADGNLQKGYTTYTADNATGSSSIMVAINCNYLDDRSIVGGNDPSLMGVAAFPRGPDGHSGNEINASMFGIFSAIQGRRNSDGYYVPAEKIREAAWRYLKFLSSNDSKKIYVDTLVEQGMGRFISPSLLKEFGYTEYLKYFPPGWEEAFEDALKSGTPEPYGRNCQMVYLYLTEPMDEAQQLIRDNKMPTDQQERLAVLKGLLDKAAKRTNAHMLGTISKEERAKRNNWAVVVAILMASVFCFAIYKIWIIFSPKDSSSGKKKGLELKRNWIGYLIMLPALLSILLWIYCPMFSGSKLLFQDYRLVGNSAFVGFSNLADVLYSSDWWNSVLCTFRYMSISLGLGFVMPIILAIMLQEVSHGKIIYRTIYYLPAVMSGLVVIYMWRLFYEPGPSGIMNQGIGGLLGLVGISFTPIAWLEDSNWAMLSCVIPSIWAGAGPGCLIYLAALKSVSDETYEASEIDGANFFQKIWHISIPTLKALVMINFVGAFIASAQNAGMIMIMTFGRANTEVAELHIFKEAYTNLRFGTAIAMAWMLGMLTLMFTIYQLKRLSSMEFKTTGR
ncbi:MAG: hypothetical protein A2X49_15505 [Lentisphaerae bacterium GWF2_52_8]|nr:MAG: hypothetical protein A2X49_15505 [Lentisphaerae bacterium GWF2_52_8]